MNFSSLQINGKEKQGGGSDFKRKGFFPKKKKRKVASKGVVKKEGDHIFLLKGESCDAPEKGKKTNWMSQSWPRVGEERGHLHLFPVFTAWQGEKKKENWGLVQGRGGKGVLVTEGEKMVLFLRDDGGGGGWDLVDWGGWGGKDRKTPKFTVWGGKHLKALLQ